jgi:APA family basic amino acid/polyamine antiporter
MAEQASGEMKRTLGLTGLTSNAMALIAPGAFLWLTFYIQATTGVSGPSMWWGIIAALLLCLATAVCYAEMAKLYPGTGSSYYFAEQAFLSRDKVFKYARLSKFIVGWGSHLYYWIYPGVMVGTMGILIGYVTGTIWPNFISASNPGPLFMMGAAVIFSFAVAYIGQRGVSSSTNVNLVINIIQIAALLIFSVIALNYRLSHPPGSEAWQFDSTSGEAYKYEFQVKTEVISGVSTDTVLRDANGAPLPKLDAAGKAVPFKISYPTSDASGNFLTHPNKISVISPHNWSWVLLQATVAILILVGFESVTTMGGEAKKSSHIPIAVILSLLIQGVVFYLFEYFAANFFLNSGYTMVNAQGSAAPIGDMMVVVGDALFGPGNGRIFMLAEAFTVFLALIGTTLSCMNTAARVTYSMGKDDEAPEHFGLLHSKNFTPHRAIWTLAIISAIVGCVAVIMPFGDGGAPTDVAVAALPHGIFSSLGYFSHDTMAAMPNSLLAVTLTSNFGTFILYALSCFLCIVAYWKHPKFNPILHLAIPIFGLLANVACMIAYLVLPFIGIGTWKEPFIALGIAGAWGLYGGIYFVLSSKKKGKSLLATKPA